MLLQHNVLYLYTTPFALCLFIECSSLIHPIPYFDSDPKGSITTYTQGVHTVAIHAHCPPYRLLSRKHAVSGCSTALWLCAGDLQAYKVSAHSFSSPKLAFHVTSATCMCRRSQSLPHDATEVGLRGLRS